MNDSHQPLIDYLSSRMSLSEGDLALIREAYQLKSVKKKEYLFRQGEPCNIEAFVLKGTFRVFYVDNRGLEHVLYFALEDWWVGDLAAFNDQTNAMLSAQALEDAEILFISRADKEVLMEKIPALERIFRIIVQKNLAALQKRFLSTISETADERYKRLLQRSPNIEQLVPQHQIASYLGILPESLSRMKRSLLKK